jgi:hypothetical protein
LSPPHLEVLPEGKTSSWGFFKQQSCCIYELKLRNKKIT